MFMIDEVSRHTMDSHSLCRLTLDNWFLESLLPYIGQWVLYSLCRLTLDSVSTAMKVGEELNRPLLVMPLVA